MLEEEEEEEEEEDRTQYNYCGGGGGWNYFGTAYSQWNFAVHQGKWRYVLFNSLEIYVNASEKVIINSRVGAPLLVICILRL